MHCNIKQNGKSITPTHAPFPQPPQKKTTNKKGVPFISHSMFTVLLALLDVFISQVRHQFSNHTNLSIICIPKSIL